MSFCRPHSELPRRIRGSGARDSYGLRRGRRHFRGDDLQQPVIERGAGLVYIDRLGKPEPAIDVIWSELSPQYVILSRLFLPFDCGMHRDFRGRGRNLDLAGTEARQSHFELVLAILFRQFRRWPTQNLAFRLNPVLEFVTQFAAPFVEEIKCPLLHFSKPLLDFLEEWNRLIRSFLDSLNTYICHCQSPSLFRPKQSSPGAIYSQREDRSGDCPDQHVNSGAITIFLCGDVMTGRGIDQILPHPSKPILYEGYVDSALDYVALAETTNGPIPRPVDFSYVWGDALAELDRMAPAARIINLETSVTTNDIPAPKGINYRMHPANTPCLAAARIDCCVLANNHVLDWGRAGLQETMSSLQGAGIGTAGAGPDLAAAVQPGVIETARAGKVLVFAFATADSGVPPDWAATGTECGISFLSDLSDATADRLAAQVSSLKRPGDVAVVSVHWGGNWGYGISRRQRAFAHRLLDSGSVDVIHGHSSHHRKAIEVYKNKLILYGCGDFLNDYEGIGGYEEFRSQLVLMYFATFDPSKPCLVGLEMTPLEIHRFRLRHAGKGDVQWLQEVLNRAGEPFGSRTIVDGANRMRLEWARS